MSREFKNYNEISDNRPLYEKRAAELDNLRGQLDKLKPGSKKYNNTERLIRLTEQSDPALEKHYGRSGKQYMTDRVPKKVRHRPGETDVLKKPVGSVWHHVVESQTGKLLFQGDLSIEELMDLNDHIGKTGMVLGNPRGAVEELPERLHKGGKSTTSQIEDIHSWVTKNTPKDASWTKLNQYSSLADRKVAATDMAEFYHKSKAQIQKLQFSAHLIDGIDGAGKASKSAIVGKDLVPGWHGNFSDQILNPRRSSIKPKVKVAGGLRDADIIARMTASAVSGDLVGGSVAAGQLGMKKVLENPKAQKAMAKQIAKLVEARGKKTLGKMIPGLDIIISGKETWDYLRQGKLDQAGIAAVSGAIGWVPVVGDGASAALDLTNTGIDIARMNIVSNPNAEKRKDNRLSAEAQKHMEDIKVDKLSTPKAPRRIKGIYKQLGRL